MVLSELEIQLREDAAQEIPPFGADSIKSARRLGKAATSFLLQEIKAHGKTAFLALEALRESDAQSYDSIPSTERAEIYARALREANFYNAWGLPGYNLTDTARALISLGEDAVAVLKPLLSDNRPALHSGSKQATTSAVYGNRVRDYAWLLICLIRNQSCGYAQDPAERDRVIEELRRSL